MAMPLGVCPKAPILLASVHTDYLAGNSGHKANLVLCLYQNQRPLLSGVHVHMCVSVFVYVCVCVYMSVCICVYICMSLVCVCEGDKVRLPQGQMKLESVSECYPLWSLCQL